MNERPDRRMATRLRAYAALAEERYELLVYPVVVNILPPAPQVEIATEYHSKGLLRNKVPNLGF